MSTTATAQNHSPKKRHLPVLFLLLLTTLILSPFPLKANDIQQMNVKFQKMLEQAGTMTPENAEQTIEAMGGMINQLKNMTPGQWDTPCSWFRQGPPVPNMFCLPLRTYITWQISENHTGTEEDFLEARWAFEEQSKGELIAYAAQGCNKLSPQCIQYFEIEIPGMKGKATQASRKVRMTDAHVRYLVPIPGKDKNRLFQADLPSFFTKADTDNLSFLMMVYPDSTKNNGFMDAPNFSWPNQFGEQGDHAGISNLRLQYDPRHPDDNGDDYISIASFLPDFHQVFDLIKKQSYSRTIPIDHTDRNSYGKTDKRVLKGTVTYALSLQPPGQLVVSKGKLSAHRTSPKKPYQPRSKVFTLHNKGNDSVSFTATAKEKWLKVTPASGRLEPGKSQSVSVTLTPAADKLKPGKHQAEITFLDTTNSTEVTRLARLSDLQKWRLSIIQKNDLFFGSANLYGGVNARVRTDIVFEVEEGKYKRGDATVSFLGAKGISYPPRVFDCLVTPSGLKIDRTSFPVKGNIVGNSVQVHIPTNTYHVHYGCVTDTDELKDFYAHSYDKLKNHKIFGKGARTVKHWKAIVKKWAETSASGVVITKEQDFTMPMYPAPGTSVTMPLKNSTKWLKGASKSSVDWEVLQMQQLE